MESFVQSQAAVVGSSPVGGCEVMDVESRIEQLDTLRPPLALIAEGLRAADPAEALAAARALTKRFQEGEDAPSTLADCVPGALFTLAFDVQLALADLVVAGLPLPIPELPEGLPPLLACRFRCAQLLAAPALLQLDVATPMDVHAVAAAPVERAVVSGLWLRAARHERSAMHDVAIDMARAAISAALLSPALAQEVLLEIAHRSSDAVRARALVLAAEPWAQGLGCPPLSGCMAGEEVALSAVRLAAARGDAGWVRRFATSEAVARTARRAAISALGGLGDAADAEVLLVLAEEDPAGAGPEALEALRQLKRRGRSLDEDQARRVIDLVLRYALLSLEAAAECASSRADAMVSVLDRALDEGAPKARVVRLLGAFGTRGAIGRLVEMAGTDADLHLSREAIRELGRLEERSAESMILARLDAEPDACLFALGRLGGAATVARLRLLLDGPPLPWQSAGLSVLFRLDSSPRVLAAAVEHGAISAETLDALPAHGSEEQREALAAITEAPGHPFRIAAIRALGRTGGPLAVDSLGGLLTDGDEGVRAEAQAALRVLGQRLATPDPPLSCLEGALDPGGALVAEAALRRLRSRPVSVTETTLLLDAVAGHRHPHLVRVVRPLLRRDNAEIRKRAVACLSAAGPGCAGWVLPYLSATTPLPVARQVLLALGGAAVPGMGVELAAWLAHPNMNLKKTAAELLARSADPRVVPALVEALAHHDQPGLRVLIEGALRALAGPFFRSLLVERLTAATNPRHEGLLATALSGAFSPAELAALVAHRPDVPMALLAHVYAADAGLMAGKHAEMDAELRRRGVGHRIPDEGDVAPGSLLRAGLARADAARRASTLSRLLRALPFEDADALSSDVVAGIQAAANGSPAILTLSIVEQRLLAGLLPRLDSTIRNDAIALLATTTDAFVLCRVLPFVEGEGKLDPRHAPLLVPMLLQRGPETARALSRASRPEVRAQAALVLRLAGEAGIAHLPPDQRTVMISSWIEAGRDDVLHAMLEGSGAGALAEVTARLAEQAGAAAAWSLAEAYVARSPLERAPALVDLAFLGEVAEPALRELARSDARGEVRRRALQALSRRRSADRALPRGLLDDPHPGVREAAAEALLKAGDRDDRALVLGAWLAGAFRKAFRLGMDEQDAPVVAAAMAEAMTEAAQLHLLGAMEALPPRERVPLLMAQLPSPHPRVAAAARDALRSLPPTEVLPFVEGQLRAGDVTWLDVIGVTGALPRGLAELARTSPDATEWLRFCLRAAGTGVLYPAGLGPSIAAWAAADPSPTALSVLARLADWYEVRHAQGLVRALAPALSGASREAVLGAMLDGLREQPPELVARVLSGLVRPTDATALLALARAEAGSPGLLRHLEPTMRIAVERTLDTALDTADPESARRLLTYFVDRTESPSERERVLALLERHVRAPSRRVRLHAHRLLRVMAPRERYLRASRALLDDADATTVRLAIRVLAFGGDVDSVAAIAERLIDAHAGVARAAREGLLALGQAAVAPLVRHRTRLRPDRRAVIDTLLTEIQSRSSSGTAPHEQG
ncbi:HEAT repeat domain-containing protein [Chondromyces crocatus]|uniref:PBS lyase n=1 Tax=Chondromyces crocatus TaxID=52 RepID=A0A0K1EL07_CHOCO|nr:HEAT repeat domain-containing protein [Chondromyces crocatus]AKT41308.1 uncharacterized protein CMC5_054820 [Chondromyces crocatus]